MNDDRFEQLLAEYLGAEIDAEGLAVFEAELARNPQRRQRVEELRAAQAALVVDLPGEGEAARRTDGLAAPNADATDGGAATLSVASGGASDGQRGVRTRTRRLSRGVLFRYAATIIMAFGAGYLSANLSATKAPAPGDVSAGPPPIAKSIGRETQAELVRNYANASRAFPHASSFTRSILALARR